jgi:hypothetical protein
MHLYSRSEGITVLHAERSTTQIWETWIRSGKIYGSATGSIPTGDSPGSFYHQVQMAAVTIKCYRGGHDHDQFRTSDQWNIAFVYRGDQHILSCVYRTAEHTAWHIGSARPGLNKWPFELQSNALPLSYPRISCSAWFQVLIQINFNKTYKSINTKVMSPVLIPSKAALA